MTAPHLPATEHRPPALPWTEGLAAGLGLGLCDWLATGVTRTPFGVVVVILIGGLAGGLLAGGIAAVVPRRGPALGLVVFGGTGLYAFSTFSKHVAAGLGGGRSLVFAGVLLVFCVLAGLQAARRFGRPAPGNAAWAALVLAAIPGASLLWWQLPWHPVVLCLTAALPIAVGILWSLVPLRPRAAAACLALAAVALSLPATVFAPHPPPHRPPPPATAHAAAYAPDIVLFLVDTLRQDHVFDAGKADPTGIFGRLAREGVRFDQAIASAPWTLPSVASLLTSQPPSRHGAVSQRRALPPEVDTLAEVLHAAGYETAAFTGGAFVSPAYGLDQGFEIFAHEAEYDFPPFHGHVPFAWRLVKNRYMPLRFVLRFVHEYGGVPALAEEVEEWLVRRDSSRPFFLLVHTYEVHDYYLYHPAPDDPLLSERGGPPAVVGDRLSVHPDELQTASPEQLAWYHDVYRRRIEFVRDELDTLLTRIEAVAGRDNLATLLTSDHGEGFDAVRHRVHHGGRLHDDLLHVPLVLRAPGRLPSGRRVETQVSGVDLMPTILALAGLPIPEGLAGRSLLPLITGEESEPHEAWSEQDLGGARLLSLRLPPWKLVSDPGRPAPVFFRLDTDPLEDHALTEPLPEALRLRFEEGLPRLAPLPGAAATDRDVGGSIRDQLGRIGY